MADDAPTVPNLLPNLQTGNSNYETFDVKIDPENATSQNIIKRVISKVLQPEPDKDTLYFEGQIVRVLDGLLLDYNLNALNRLSKLLANKQEDDLTTGFAGKRYKINVFSKDNHIPRPTGLGNKEKNHLEDAGKFNINYDNFIIDVLMKKEFISKDGVEYKEGDLVIVSYGNKSADSYGIIEQKIGDPPPRTGDLNNPGNFNYPSVAGFQGNPGNPALASDLGENCVKPPDALDIKNPSNPFLGSPILTNGKGEKIFSDVGVSYKWGYLRHCEPVERSGTSKTAKGQDGITRVYMKPSANRIRGIDLSQYNAPFSLKELTNDEAVKFVYIRCGIFSSKDSSFDKFWKESQPYSGGKNYYRGPYYFPNTKGNSSAKDQLEFVKKVLNKAGYDKEQDMPIALDFEGDTSANMDANVVYELVMGLREYSGKWPVVYTAPYYWESPTWGPRLANIPNIGQCPLWVPTYDRNTVGIPLPWTTMNIWQFGAMLNMRNKGVGNRQSPIDQNYFFGTMSDLQRFVKGQ